MGRLIPTYAELMNDGRIKKGGISKAILKRRVWKRDKGICKLCGDKIGRFDAWDLARDRAGQPYTEKNCFVAHHTCNLSQGRKTKKQTLRGIGIGKRRKRATTKKKRRRKQYPFGIGQIKPLGVSIGRFRGIQLK